MNQLTRYVLFLVCTLLYMSCATNDDIRPEKEDPIANLRSQQCPGVTGMPALHWDIFNSIPRGDIPDGLPTIREVEGHFMHSG